MSLSRWAFGIVILSLCSTVLGLPMTHAWANPCLNNPSGNSLTCGPGAGACFAYPYNLSVGTNPTPVGDNRSPCCFNAIESTCAAGQIRASDNQVVPLVCPRRDVLGNLLSGCGMNCIAGALASCDAELSGCERWGFPVFCPTSRTCAASLDRCPENQPTPTPPATATPQPSPTPSEVCTHNHQRPCASSCFNPAREVCDAGHVCPKAKPHYRCGECMAFGSAALGDLCKSDSQCRVGQCSGVCGISTGKCVCNDDRQCAGGQYCYKGVADIGTNQCKAKLDNRKACTKDKQCKSGRCYWGSCKACDKDSQCGSMGCDKAKGICRN